MAQRGIATRIALAALAAAALGLLILALGVLVVGGQVFTDLMMKAGDSAEHARAMYDSSVTTVSSLIECAVRGSSVRSPRWSTARRSPRPIS